MRNPRNPLVHGEPTALVIDDSDLNCAVIERILTRHGLRVMTASDGAEGAVLALRSIPDIVITDLEMPVMDGYQLARLLKSDPSTRHIPILILTSHGEASSRFWSRETGADAYLIKSGLEDELVSLVDDLLQRSSPGVPVAAEPLYTPLDVLARVSRQLDARLLEAVLVNRILERGMQAESLAEASKAILETVSHIADAWLLGLGVAEPESATVFLELGPEVSRGTIQEIVSRLTQELEISSLPREVAIVGGADSGRDIDPRDLHLLFLPLRDAQAVVAIAPREAGFHQSREYELLSHARRNLALVLDNARLAQRLRELSMRDGLTKLLNRRTIQLRLCEEVERAVRYGHPLSIALCDLDHFKQVNDSYGHEAGDLALVAVAEVLEQQARSPDVAGRFGGEEFLLLLPETHLEDACRAARRLCEAVAGCDIELPGGRRIAITGSLGVAGISELGAESTPDGILRLADQRLYKAKAAGRNQVKP